MPFHQVKNVPIYTGHKGSNICIDDWIRDTKYLIDSTSMATHMQFGPIVRYLGGAARKLVLNLSPEQQTPNHAFAELRPQFGDMSMLGDPLADFYERFRLPNESPGIYAVELEATIRAVEERINRTHPMPNRNKMLTQQFMRGVHDDKITSRLAPMKPREMSFRELQIELRQIDREARTSAAFKPRPDSKAQTQPQYIAGQATALPLHVQQKQPKATPKTQMAPPDNQHVSKQQQTSEDVIQSLVVKLQALAQTVEHLTSRQNSTDQQQMYHSQQQQMYHPQQQHVYHPRQEPNYQQPQHQQTYPLQSDARVFVCHRCGHEGHIARGCRMQPLNFKGPRSKGKPLDAQNSAQ